MAVKRRRSKQRLSTMDEMNAWSLYFECGRDYMDAIDGVLDPHRPSDMRSGALDDLSPTEREAVILDAWRRLGGLFLESAEVERKSRDDPNWKPYALLRYGPPG